MRSLYVSLFAAMLLSLSLTLAAFSIISSDMDRTYVVPVFEAMDAIQLDGARGALAQGGRPALKAYLAGLDRRFGTAHFLAYGGGRDVVSGANLTPLLPPPPADRSRGFVGKQFVVTLRAPDRRYWIISRGRQEDGGWPFRPYALVAVAMAGLLSIAAALFIIAPLRRLTGAVRRFGCGELGARAPARRRDEIGVLARTFNEMAERIERLVTGERRLLQDISHELRSPLARLKLAVRLARNAPDQEAALNRIERDIDRITALTGELIEMTRLDGEARAPAMDSLELAPLVLEVVEDCQPEPPRDIRCALELKQAVRCDPSLLRPALENVLRNAVRHAPLDTPIELSARQTGGMTVLTVRDHGPGVPDEALQKIFRPFYRVDEARSADSGGLGLGLAIARSAIQRQGGTITARNARPGLIVDIVLES